MVARKVKDEVKKNIEEWLAKGHRRPCLICVLVGEDPASTTYVKKKMEAAEYVGEWMDYCWIGIILGCGLGFG